MDNLFQWRDFIGHSGDLLHFRIECDALTSDDWAAVAELVMRRVSRFSKVEGVPRGGLQLAHWLSPYATGYKNDPLLIVDDVWTTGSSMREHRAGRDAIGAVLFARNPVESWVTPIFQLSPKMKSSKDVWPQNCPVCGGEWKIKSKTMGKANGQPHKGRCVNGHWWSES